ncbi:hypothetical protein A2165_02285 [Candidatus Curtissbacteria bacterium RBG_13_40_7]|uniref:Xylose isomerase-like TIM barrel domain-containing protein n=1 Tax=Candidatus Curtissbacteria bacterium RBG_13_40_7 TaxID=1797706 RepID=A0A1F5FYE7_9BACT|nr:MAG: hypothetical protein A2165_02285 [Candidatus Curtissbacteria bacterium RBG_13_40_7]
MSAERRVEVTSSGWLFDPERLFWIVGQINKERPARAQVALELYPTIHNPFWQRNQTDSRVSLDRIKRWQNEHGPVPIERIHLPFHYDILSALQRFFIHSVFKEPGTLRNRAIAMGAAWMTWVASNEFAQNLAGELSGLQGSRVGLSAHVYLVEKAGPKGIKKLQGRADYVLVENDLDYPRSNPEQLMAERDPQRAIRAVESYGLEGIILGVDHDFLNKLDPVETFEQNLDGLRRHLKVTHLAGSEGFRGKDLLKDPEFWRVVDYISKKRDFDSVKFCLDLNPIEMQGLTNAEQLDYISALVRELEK